MSQQDECVIKVRLAEQQLKDGDKIGAAQTSTEACLIPYNLQKANDVFLKPFYEYYRYKIFSETHSGEMADIALKHCQAITNTSMTPKVKRWAKIVIDGGLGNKLFQIAFLLGFCKKMNYNPVIDMSHRIKPAHEFTDWSWFFRTIPLYDITYANNEKTVLFKEDQFQNGKFVSFAIEDAFKDANIIFRGFFQSEKYFLSIKDEIVNLFSPSKQIENELIKKYDVDANTMFVHVRRGDKTPSNTLHYLDVVDYTKRSIDYALKINPAMNFIVVSDDLEWCKHADFISSLPSVRYGDENEVNTLFLMSICPMGGISSYSTLGWWGLWLNASPTKLSIFPNRLLADERYDTTDLIPSNFTTAMIYRHNPSPTFTKPKGYVINLRHRPDRFNTFKAKFDFSDAKNVIDLQRVDGVVGKDVVWTPDLFYTFRCERTYPKTNPWGYHNENPGEIGCALSHIGVWKQIASSNDDNIHLIFEDDVSFNQDFPVKFEKLTKYLKESKTWDICFLGSHDDIDIYEDPLVTTLLGDSVNNKFSLKRFNPTPPIPRMNGGGLFSYILTSHSAQKLLDFIELHGVPQAIDWVVFETFSSMVALKCQPHLVSSPIYGANTYDSNIQKKDDININAVSLWHSPDVFHKYWKKMSMDNNGRWGRLKLVPTNDAVVTCVVNHPGNNKISKNLILYHMEPSAFTNNLTPPFNKSNDDIFLNSQTHDRTHNNLEWQVSSTFQDFMNDRVDLTKTKGDVLSILISSLYTHPGHRYRIDFVKYLEQRLELDEDKISFDLRGRCKGLFKSPHLGELAHGEKDISLYPYKYTFNVENNSEKNYMTEKIVDGIMAECLCFYWGCPNYTEYFPADCVKLIPLDASFEECYDIIVKSIQNDEWSKCINSIRRAKFDILTRLGYFPTLDKILNANGENDSEILRCMDMAKDFEDHERYQESYDLSVKALSLYSPNIDLEMRLQIFKRIGTKLGKTLATIV